MQNLARKQYRQAVDHLMIRTLYLRFPHATIRSYIHENLQMHHENYDRLQIENVQYSYDCSYRNDQR